MRRAVCQHFGDFRAKHFAQVFIGANRRAKISEIGLKGEGRDQGYLSIDDSLQCFIIHVGRMQDHVETCERCIPCAGGVAAVSDHGDTELVGGIANKLQLI